MKHPSGLLVAIVMLAAALVATAGTASAASKVTYYLSLGDSWAAGYQPGDDPVLGGSHGYADQLFKAVRGDYQQLRLVKMGCGGETALGMIVGDVGCPRHL